MLLPIGHYQGITENALSPHFQSFHTRSLTLGPFLHFFPLMAKVAQTFVQQNWVFLALLQVLGQPQGNGVMTINQQSHSRTGGSQSSGEMCQFPCILLTSILEVICVLWKPHRPHFRQKGWTATVLHGTGYQCDSKIMTNYFDCYTKAVGQSQISWNAVKENKHNGWSQMVSTQLTSDWCFATKNTCVG